MSVQLDKTATIRRADGTLAIAAFRQLYVLQTNGSLTRTIDPANVTATETLAQGYADEALTMPVAQPFIASSDGKYAVWFPLGTYDIYAPGDATRPIMRWQPVPGVDVGTINALSARTTDVEAQTASLGSSKADISATVLETTDVAEPRALEVYTTNPLSGRKERFVVENNQDTDEVDINFRNCTVNFGDQSAAVSTDGSAIFQQPSGGTSSPIQVCKPGNGPLGHKVFQVVAAGAIQLGIGGLSSVAIRVNAEGEANDRWWLGELGEMRWGPGGATALDTDFKRLQSGIMEVGQIGAVGRLQIGFDSTIGYVQSRDNASSTFKALSIAGSSIDIAPNNTSKLKLNTTGVGFFGTTPAAKPTGVAVTAAGVHAALVTLGLIAA